VADYREAFVGIDVAKLRNAITIADAGREGEVRFFGDIDASAIAMCTAVQIGHWMEWAPRSGQNGF
jgi:transposase